MEKDKKERITITLSRKLLEKIDKLVDGADIRNRSHAIERLIKSALGMGPRTAVILAGGRKEFRSGKIYHGKTILLHLVDWIRKYGADEIIIAGPRKKIANLVPNDVRIQDERSPLGTAGALAKLKDELSQTFLVVYGDIFTNLNLKKFYSFHRKNNGIVTMALKNVDNPSRFGSVELEGVTVTKLVEKGEPVTNLVNAGIYLMEPEVLEMCKEGKDIVRDVLPQLIEQGKVFGYPFPEDWVDVKWIS